MSIKYKLIILTASLLLIALTSSLTISLYFMKESHDLSLDKIFAQTERTIESIFATTKETLKHEAKALSETEWLNNFTTTSNYKKLQKILDTLSFDFIDVIDSDGQLITRITNNKFQNLKAIKKRSKTYNSIIKDKKTTDGISTFMPLGHNLTLVAAATIKNKVQKNGLILVGKVLDNDFAKEMRGLTGTDISFSFFHDKKVLSTSLAAKTANKLELELINNRLTFDDKVEIDNSLFFAFQILDEYLNIVGQYTILQSLQKMEETNDKIIKTMLIIFFLIILLSLFLAQHSSKSLIKNLLNVINATEHIANGDFSDKLPETAKDEVGKLSRSVNNMSNKIIKLLEDEKVKAEYQNELKTADAVQRTFFSDPAILEKPFKIASFYTPATSCGGDWWGHYTVAPGVKLIIIADATGHGVPAALITAMAYSTSSIYANWLKEKPAGEEHDPALILSSLNQLLYNSLQGKLCMTFFAAIIDSHTKTIKYSNGGHNFPYLIPKDPHDERVSKKHKNLIQTIPLKYINNIDSSILGVNPNVKFSNDSFKLKLNDRIVFFTDGLTEATSPEGKMWGTRRLLKAITKHDNDDINSVLANTIDDFKSYHNSDIYADDVTFVLFEYTG